MPSDLDEQDTARLLPIVAALNTYQSLKNVTIDFLNSHGKRQPSENDWAIYVLARDAAQEVANG